ncbi:S-layer homology domain-containing protein [Paenibacillus chibensis]|uniref:S-layer homology domain-containing protein n=1 Tax=Paenibacillus chibensis TaxID=59846 RepID=A0ABU6PW53_9BACL|nr:S-layer homology domain-containing protein [Paenibacillus chibensis]
MKKTILALLAGGALVLGAFSMGQGNHATAAPAAFKDVPASHWAKNAIDDAVSKGYLKGEGNGNFRPNAAVTRAEFAAILDRVSTNELQTDAGAETFADLAGHWSEKEVSEAAGKGFFQASDYPGGFKPNTPLTRVEMAKWMATGLAAKDADYKTALKDTIDTLVPVAEYYKGGLGKAEYPYVSVVLGTGLMTGYTDGSFGPDKNTTRAEVATILMRFENVQNQKANSFRDLNEMREVGLTGSNLESLTPHRYVINAQTKEKYSFDRVRDLSMNLTRNLGTEIIHRMIIVDANADKTTNNLYGEMFVDKDFDRPFQTDRYLVFIDVTVTPSTGNLDNLAFGSANSNVFLNGFSFSTGTQKTFGITPLPAGKHYVLDGFFIKDKPVRFWMGRSLNKEIILGDDNGNFFNIGNEVVSFKIPQE